MNAKIQTPGKYFGGNRVELIRSGKYYFKKLEGIIDTASHEIYLQCYILKDDETGKGILESLINAAQRGVKVCMLLDAFGSNALNHNTLLKLKKAGIEVLFYGRFYLNGKVHFGRRLHHKIISIDGIRAIVGGINIGNDYNDIRKNPPWLDFAVEVSGPIAGKLHSICRKFQVRTLRQYSIQNFKSKQLHKSPVFENASLVAIVQNDYRRGKNQIAKTYRQAIRQATTTIDIAGAYFLPGRRMRNFLKEAIARGVKIRLIFPGKSDVWLAAHARTYLYDWLLRNKIEIYEYQPANVHAKVLLTDSNFISIGSFDLNNLSTYSNIELNLNIHDFNLGNQIMKEFDAIINNECKRITSAVHQQHENWWGKLISWSSYRLVKSLFYLSWKMARVSEK